jgi:uncharacterized repeat protein (TIGR03803 family)
MPHTSSSHATHRPLATCIAIVTLICLAAATASAQTLTTSYRFLQTSSGSYPDGELLADAAGNLYGTTQSGGGFGQGAVFELSPNGSGWTETVLYSFAGGTDGYYPGHGVIADKAGNLYGTTLYGGTSASYGTVYQLTPPSAPGGAWTENVLYRFQGIPARDGEFPTAGLVMDAAGNLYGETVNGGTCTTNQGSGVVFELSPPAISGGSWTEQVLYSFQWSCNNHDAGGPQGGLTLDSHGNLLGVTTFGSKVGISAGTIFRLRPPALGQTRWTEQILHNFIGGSDGSYPYGQLILDSKGNLYGTTEWGGTGCSSSQCGTVFELSPPTAGGAWTESILYQFTGNSDGQQPFGALVADRRGNLFGTTSAGGDIACSCGTVFELTPPATQGAPWAQSTLHAFTGGADGSFLSFGLTMGHSGSLYGTTTGSGSKKPQQLGTIFRIVP